ncbi:MAG TPA: hypothetical protein VG389_21970 [Myxococcota bacterium]|nr:hypothetical protein [Myxococcota bacterium]
MLRPCGPGGAAACAAALVLGALLAPGVAGANGRLPAFYAVFPRPAVPAALDLGATFGLVSTTDDGATWSWVCEASIGYMGTLDPLFLRPAGGALLASTFAGLTRSLDGGCTFDPVADVGDGFVCGMIEHPTTPGTVYVATGSCGTGTSQTSPRALYVSTDGGLSFAATTLTSPTVDYDGVLATPADPLRLYVGGWLETAAGAYVYRSDDGGATWTEIPKTASTGDRLRVLAVSDSDPDVLFWMVDGATASVYRSDDGAATETEVLTTPGYYTGFALAQGGGTAWAGTSYNDLYRSDDGGLTFAPVLGAPAPSCVATRGARVYICANPYMGNFAVGWSDDDGLSWNAELYLADVDGPLACPPGTPTHDVCEPIWPALETLLDPFGAPDAGAKGTDAGAAGDGGGAGGGDGGSGRHGCGCALAGRAAPRRTGAGPTALLLGLLGALGALRARWRGPAAHRAPPREDT